MKEEPEVMFRLFLPIIGVMSIGVESEAVA